MNYLPLLALFSTLTLYLLHHLLTFLRSPLRSIPGPFPTPFTRLYYFLLVFRGRAEHDLLHLHKLHSPPGRHFAPIIRLGPNLFSISRPEKAIYGVGSKAPKSAWYEGWKHPDPERWTLFPDRNVGRHAETRRRFQGMYSLSSLVLYEGFVDSAQRVFGERLREMAGKEGKKEWVDLHHWLQCFAFDVVGNLSFGRRFGFLDEGRDVGRCMASLKSAMFYSALVGIYPWAHPVLYRIMERLPGSGAAGRTYIMRFVAELVAERRKQRENGETPLRPTAVDDESSPKDFLDVILDAEGDPKKGVTPYHVFMMGLSNVIAGSDTTAVSLSSVMYYLLKNPQSLAKLRLELDDAVNRGKMTREHISFKESQELPYLQACIKEGLRLCTAVALPLWRVVPKGGIQMLDTFFPEGSEVGLNPWVLHYDHDVWREDAEEFRPERWVEASSERLKFMDNNFAPFGLGSRTCLGRHISYLEICKVIPMIVSTFDFELQHPDRDWTTTNFWFVRPTDFFVSIKLRSQHS